MSAVADRFTPETTYFQPRPGRNPFQVCLICRRRSDRLRRLRKPGAEAPEAVQTHKEKGR